MQHTSRGSHDRACVAAKVALGLIIEVDSATRCPVRQAPWPVSPAGQEWRQPLRQEGRAASSCSLHHFSSHVMLRRPPLTFCAAFHAAAPSFPQGLPQHPLSSTFLTRASAPPLHSFPTPFLLLHLPHIIPLLLPPPNAPPKEALDAALNQPRRFRIKDQVKISSIFFH